MARVTASGVEAFTLSEHLGELLGLLRATFGENIDISDESPQMQFMALFALALAQGDEGIVGIQNAFNLLTAAGVFLDNLGSLLALPRRGARRTTFTQQVTGTVDTELHVGTLAANADDQLFEVAVAATIGADGTAVVSWRSLFDGPIPANPLTRIVTTVPGWDGVTAPTTTAPIGSASVGRNAETDAAYRTRLIQTAARNRMGPQDAIESALLSIEGMDRVRVEVNDTGAPVTRGGIAIGAHTVLALWRSVEAATVAGATVEAATVAGATVEAALGSSVTYGIPHSHQQASPRRMSVAFEITPGNDYPANGDALIKSAIVALVGRLGIGEPLDVNTLYGPIFSVSGHTVTSALTVQWNASSGTDAPDVALPATIGLDLYLTLDQADITISRP